MLSGKERDSTRIDTNVHWQRFSVPYEFPVYFTKDIFGLNNPALVETVGRLEPERRHRCLFFVDDGLLSARKSLCDEIEAYAKHHSTQIELVATPIRIPGGERIKTDLFFVEQMQQTLYDHRMDRHSYVIAVGGGAVLDAVGLVAAVAHRGVRHIRIPSTVLAQNDSGVGVKNGVNLNGTKNFVGTFAPPFAVLNDMDLIGDLETRDKIAGMAEAIKVALIRDAAFFTWLERHADDLVLFENEAMAYMIRRCAELHMHQIANGGDPFEMGSARPLDYGHWAAHKLEILTRHHLRHGEAVAIGVALDTHYSVLKGMLDPSESERIFVLLEHLGFRLWHSALEKKDGERNAVLEGLREFKEHLGGELTVTLLAGIGKGMEVHEMDEDLISSSIAWLKMRDAS